LSQLVLWGCSRVTDIGPIANQRRLSYLDLEGTGVCDLSPLSGLSRLTTLWLRGCSEIRDIAALEALPRLRVLHLAGVAPGVDLGPLGGNKGLKVYINANQKVRNYESLLGRLEMEYDF